VEHIDEMCDNKDKDAVVPCPTECQDMKTNVGSECMSSLSGSLTLGENCPGSVRRMTSGPRASPKAVQERKSLFPSRMTLQSYSPQSFPD
jgi:hypothetical protein